MAGRKSWEAAIPIYNAVILMKIINRPTWWVILLFVPIVNLIMFLVIWVETIRSYGKNTLLDTFLVVCSLGLYVAYLNYFSMDLSYINKRSLKPKTSIGEWISSMLFAIVVATIVHTYLVQPYVIPSSSLEKTLLVGDFLFVSKINYGARIPLTTIAFPMVHDTIPVINCKSYLFNDAISKKETSWFNKFQLPYLRLPGFQRIKRNDLVVFNQPADTLLDMSNFHPNRNYYKPIDKKTNLIKRCVGLPGDTLSIINGYVFINNKKSILPKNARLQFAYFVETKGGKLTPKYMYERFGVTDWFGEIKPSLYYFKSLTNKAVKKLLKNPNVVAANRDMVQMETIVQKVFPYSGAYKNTVNQFEAVYIPKAGRTIQLNKGILPLYKRVIEEYEHNELKLKGNQIFINGKEAKTYTFKQDYYWMMGDNRDNSIDSRFWGFVPFDHIIGKPVLIWFSWNKNEKGIIKKIRWKRLLTSVEGSSKSYFIYFAILTLAYLGYTAFRRNRK
ncbi:signal peptidase I [Galbibacter sp. PAP.153]|uniref:signal peptidase I n=1 Tax=Galbibacter sp. PAP.153 TaxID=3104623 RepID=UPI0030085D6C